MNDLHRLLADQAQTILDGLDLEIKPAERESLRRLARALRVPE